MKRLGPYELRGELARGAMGIVFRAHDPALDRPLALKVIRSEDLRDPESQQRFLRELRILARLRHPHVIAVHSAGLSDHGYPYVAMDLIEGGSLRDRLDREVRLPIREAVRIAVQLAEALAYAHSRGVLHRDLKPHNVLLDEGDAVLTDFGLAKIAAADAQGLTRSGDRIGTPLYMAPEQARGENRRVGPPTDVYALGVTLFQMLTGVLPFAGGSVLEVFEKIAHQPPEPLRRFRPEVDAALDAIVARCLAKEPEDRYPTASALRDALVSWQESGDRTAAPNAETVRARPLSSLARSPEAASAPHPPRHGLALKAGLGLGLALGGLVLGLVSAGSVERTLRRDVWSEELPQPLRSRSERGIERFLRDDFVGALEDLDHVIASEPNCSSAWYRRARTLRALEREPEARADLDRALEIDPEFAEAYSVRAQLRQDADPAGSLADYDRAVALEPLNPVFYRNRAALHYKEGRDAEALEDVERSLALDPRFAQSHYLRGAIKRRTESPEAALADWERAIGFEPGQAEILNARGLLRSELGDSAGAAADYTAAIAALLEKPVYHHNRAATFEARGDYLSALADLNNALEVDPEHGPTYSRRAVIHVRLRRYAEAADDYERAGILLQGEPDSEVLVRNALRLRSAMRRGLHQVQATRLNLRAKPGASQEIIGELPQGTMVQVLGEENGWAQVQVEDSRGQRHVGFVSSAYLALVVD